MFDILWIDGFIALRWTFRVFAHHTLHTFLWNLSTLTAQNLLSGFDFWKLALTSADCKSGMKEWMKFRSFESRSRKALEKHYSAYREDRLCVYDFLLSDKNYHNYIKIVSSKLYNGSEWWSRFWSPKKCVHPSYKVLHTALGVNRSFLKWIDAFLWEEYPY